MPTVTTLSSAARGAGARGRQPYMVQHEIDIAAAVTAKGSALAAGDIVAAISVTAETDIQLTLGDASTITVTPGIATDVDVDDDPSGIPGGGN